MTRLGWIAFTLLALGLFVLTVDRVAERGRFATAYSSYGSGPRGSRALFLLIEERLGQAAPPMRWAQDLARLPPRAVLVALGGCDAAMARPLSRYERQELVRWVRSGGVLFVAGARDYLPQAFGVHFMPEDDCEGGSTREASSEIADAGPARDAVPVAPDLGDDAAENSAGSESSDELDAAEVLPAADTTWAIPMAPALRGLPVIPLRQPGELALVPDLEPEIVLGDPRRDSSGAERDVMPLGVVLRHGLGRVIVLASASMLQNRELGPSDGGALFLRLLRSYAGGLPVLFDEYHLGIGERRSLMLYLRQMGAVPLVLQMMLAIGLLLWRAGARFGGVQPPVAAPPAGTASFVAALGRLYERTADPGAAIELIAREALGRIAAHHHLEPGPAARLRQALSARGAGHAAEAVEQIALAAESGRDSSASRLPGLVARIDAAVAQACTDPAAR